MAVLAAACGRSGSSASQTTTPPSAGTSSDSSSVSTAAGKFGTMDTAVCGKGNPSGSPARGVTADAIQVGTIADPGFAGRPGLDQELFDTAKVFAAWCNAAGGINGRKIELIARDDESKIMQSSLVLNLHPVGADIDLQALRLPVVLIDLVAKDGDRDHERADDCVEDVAIVHA